MYKHDIENVMLGMKDAIDHRDMDEVEGLSDIDLCRIFGVLLDNAIEAALESNEKKILLRTYEVEGQLFFEVRNSYKEAPDMDQLMGSGVRSLLCNVKWS